MFAANLGTALGLGEFQESDKPGINSRRIFDSHVFYAFYESLHSPYGCQELLILESAALDLDKASRSPL